MSKQGIKVAARVFSEMQEARNELLKMGTVEPITESSKQDILLGHMLDNAKDAIKDDFVKITSAKT